MVVGACFVGVGAVACAVALFDVSCSGVFALVLVVWVI